MDCTAASSSARKQPCALRIPNPVIETPRSNSSANIPNFWSKEMARTIRPPDRMGLSTLASIGDLGRANHRGTVLSLPTWFQTARARLALALLHGGRRLLKSALGAYCRNRIGLPALRLARQAARFSRRISRAIVPSFMDLKAGTVHDRSNKGHGAFIVHESLHGETFHILTDKEVRWRIAIACVYYIVLGSILFAALLK